MPAPPPVGDNGGPPIERVDWRMYDGYVAESRASRDHPLIGYGKTVKPADPSRGSYSRNEAWRDLIHECRFEDGYVMNGGHKMRIERGQLVGAISWLAHRWNWTPKTVRGFLDALAEDGMITRDTPGTTNEQTFSDETGSKKGMQRGKQAQVITVCNYSKFNSFTPMQGSAEGHAKGTQGARKGHAEGNIYKEEELKNGRTEEPIGPRAPSAREPDRSAGDEIRADMIAEVVRVFGPGTERNAEKWLASTVSEFGWTATVQGYRMLLETRGTGQGVAKPLAMWSTLCRSAKEREAKAAAQRISGGAGGSSRGTGYVGHQVSPYAPKNIQPGEAFTPRAAPKPYRDWRKEFGVEDTAPKAATPAKP